MRRGTILLETHISWILSNSWKRSLAKHILIALSCHISGFEEVRSDYFVLWQCAPNQNRGRVLQRLVYLLLTLWTPWPTVLFFQNSGNWEFTLSRKKTRLRNDESSPNPFREYGPKEIQFSLSESVIWWCLCSLYGKSVNFCRIKWHIAVWGTPVWAGSFRKDNVRCFFNITLFYFSSQR